MRYHHVLTGREYEGRGEPYVYDVPGQGISLMKVPVIDENGRSTVVYEHNLEAIVDQNAAPADPVEALQDRLPGVVVGTWPPGPDPVDWGEAEHRDVEHAGVSLEVQAELQQQEHRHELAMELAGDLSFHLGNALMEMLYGNLDLAIEALVRERHRRYPAAITTPEEAHDE